jgi:hypothetical protein
VTDKAADKAACFEISYHEKLRPETEADVDMRAVDDNAWG